MPTDYEQRGRDRDRALTEQLERYLPGVTVRDSTARVNAEQLAQVLARLDNAK